MLVRSVTLAPRPELPLLRIPQLKMTAVQSTFSLADITDLEPFRQLGQRIAADPTGSLRRVEVGAHVVTGPDGLRRIELVTERASDEVASPASLFAPDELRRKLIESVLSAPVAPSRPNQAWPASQIVDAFLSGLGADVGKVLSGYLPRATTGLLQLLTEEQRKYAAKPRYDEVVDLAEFAKVRTGRAEESQDG